MLEKMTVSEALHMISLTFLNPYCEYRTFLQGWELTNCCHTHNTHSHSPSGVLLLVLLLQVRGAAHDPSLSWRRIISSSLRVQFVAPCSSFLPGNTDPPLTSPSLTSGSRKMLQCLRSVVLPQGDCWRNCFTASRKWTFHVRVWHQIVPSPSKKAEYPGSGDKEQQENNEPHMQHTSRFLGLAAGTSHTLSKTTKNVHVS